MTILGEERGWVDVGAKTQGTVISALNTQNTTYETLLLGPWMDRERKGLWHWSSISFWDGGGGEGARGGRRKPGGKDFASRRGRELITRVREATTSKHWSCWQGMGDVGQALVACLSVARRRWLNGKLCMNRFTKDNPSEDSTPSKRWCLQLLPLLWFALVGPLFLVVRCQVAKSATGQPCESHDLHSVFPKRTGDGQEVAVISPHVFSSASEPVLLPVR